MGILEDIRNRFRRSKFNKGKTDAPAPAHKADAVSSFPAEASFAPAPDPSAPSRFKGFPRIAAYSEDVFSTGVVGSKRGYESSPVRGFGHGQNYPRLTRP